MNWLRKKLRQWLGIEPLPEVMVDAVLLRGPMNGKKHRVNLFNLPDSIQVPISKECEVDAGDNVHAARYEFGMLVYERLHADTIQSIPIAYKLPR